MSTDKINYEIDVTKAPFLYLNHHPKNYFDSLSVQLAKNGKNDDWVFRNTFMCDRNVKYINNQIKKQVYNNSCYKYIISDQKFEHLYIIMAEIYDHHARHISSYKKEELDILNQIVIDFCAKVAVSNITHRYKSLRSRTSQPVPLPTPKSCSIKGTKSYVPMFTESAEDFTVDQEPTVYSRSIMVDSEGIDKYCGKF
mgnify:CR=1 FL=1